MGECVSEGAGCMDEGDGGLGNGRAVLAEAGELSAFCEGGKIRVGVEVFNQEVVGEGFEPVCLLVVGEDGEGGGEAGVEGIFSKKGCAESVDGGDGGGFELRESGLDVVLILIGLLKGFVELGGDAFA